MIPSGTDSQGSAGNSNKSRKFQLAQHLIDCFLGCSTEHVLIAIYYNQNKKAALLNIGELGCSVLSNSVFLVAVVVFNAKRRT